MEVGGSSRNTLEHAMLFNLFFFHIRYFFLLFLFALGHNIKKIENSAKFFKVCGVQVKKNNTQEPAKSQPHTEVCVRFVPSYHAKTMVLLMLK